MKTKQHPEDLIANAEAQTSAAERINDWALKHIDALWAMMLIYDDDEAQALLEALREKFWTE